MSSNEDINKLTTELISILVSGDFGHSEIEKLNQVKNFLDTHPETRCEYLNNLAKPMIDHNNNTNNGGVSVSPLFVAAEQQYAQIMNLLAKSGANLTFQDEWGRTPLMGAIEGRSSPDFDKNDLEMQKRLECIIELTADTIGLRARQSGRNALWFAVWNEDLFAAEILIRRGADVNSIDILRLTPLFYAVVKDNLQMAQVLLEQNANVNARSDSEATPLMWVRSIEMCQLLVRNRAEIDARDKNGQTTLMLVDNEDICEELIRLEADIYIKDNMGKTSLEYAIEKCQISCAQTITKIILEDIYLYFNGNSPENIRKQIQTFILTQNEEIFPIKTHHILALELFKKNFKEDESFLTNLSCILSYFASVDFRDKILADVVNLLVEKNVTIDNETLHEKRARAKTDQELNEIGELFERLDKNRRLTEKFYKLATKINSLNVLKIKS